MSDCARNDFQASGAASVSAIGADVGELSPEVERLIEAQRLAAQFADAAMDARQDAEERCRELLATAGLEDWWADKDAVARKRARAGDVTMLPTDNPQLRRIFDARAAERSAAEINKFERRRKKAEAIVKQSGLRAALKQEQEAWDANLASLSALCVFPCRNLAELRQIAAAALEYLKGFGDYEMAARALRGFAGLQRDAKGA